MCPNVCQFFRKFSRFVRNVTIKLPTNQAEAVSTRKISQSVKLDKRFTRSPLRYSKFSKPDFEKNVTDFFPSKEVEDEMKNELQNIISKTLYIKEIGHQVLIIQPYIKWGAKRKSPMSLQFQLDEAVALIKTLRNWNVTDTMFVPLENFLRPYLFGSGKMDSLKDMVRNNPRITAVFINLELLRLDQFENLQREFQVPVYDRYTIVMHIFREHATTKEAQLQVKLAELPYLKSRLKSIDKGSLINFGCENTALGSVWRGKEFHDQLLKQRESEIKEEIRKLREHRKKIRKSRLKNEIPTVAVVGYTNAGKTSLIKALTGREKLQPQDYLFATLDVTVHEGILPSSMRVLFVDTIGFMSDLPTSLFESFVATLEDVQLADVVIHVRDISHPDNVAQDENVKETLKLLELPETLKDNMITVGNKIDLLTNDELEKWKESNIIFVSAKKMIGTDHLLQKIDEAILKSTKRKVIVMKVKISGEEYCWLHENSTVVKETPCPEGNQYTLLKVLITNVALTKFKHYFIKEYYKTRRQG